VQLCLPELHNGNFCRELNPQKPPKHVIIFILLSLFYQINVVTFSILCTFFTRRDNKMITQGTNIVTNLMSREIVIFIFLVSAQISVKLHSIFHLYNNSYSIYHCLYCYFRQHEIFRTLYHSHIIQIALQIKNCSCDSHSYLFSQYFE